jgi:hypothetical protein
MTDPFDAAKHAMEGADRDRALIQQARELLARCDDDWRQWPLEAVFGYLSTRGPFSLPDAAMVLERLNLEERKAEATEAREREAEEVEEVAAFRSKLAAMWFVEIPAEINPADYVKPDIRAQWNRDPWTAFLRLCDADQAMIYRLLK